VATGILMVLTFAAGNATFGRQSPQPPRSAFAIGRFEREPSPLCAEPMIGETDRSIDYSDWRNHT
jgi:hypothetical protein